MLVHTAEGQVHLLDFFVAAPGRGLDDPQPAELTPAKIWWNEGSFQLFHIGASSCGVYGNTKGLAEALARFGTMPLSELVGEPVRAAREGVEVSEQQEYLFKILDPLLASEPEGRAVYNPEGRALRAGDKVRFPELGDLLERLGEEGPDFLYTGDVAAAVSDWVLERGGLITREDLAAYEVIERVPARAHYRGREVLTNPPPSAGGILIAHALAMLDGVPGPPSVVQLVEVMERTQKERTPEFLAGLDDPRFVREFLARPVGRLGSTTHIAALDRDGWACSVTCSNGSASGVIVPGTGVHLNNMLGEQDLNPLGFHHHPPGRRMPSMMSPTIVLRDGAAQLAVGSAGSNRIRSAVLQTIIRSIDDGLEAQDAIDAPRVHFEDDMVYCEPGVDVAALESAGRSVSPFRARNLFFGGAQAAALDLTGRFSGGGDPRRGGAAIVVEAV